MSKLQNMRGIEIPKFRAVSSGAKTFDELFGENGFCKWIDDLNEAVSCMTDWIKNSGVFEYGDFPKSGMCNMPNVNGAFDAALGIAQQQIFLPIKLRAK